jgi:hypothetical protein
MSSLVPKPPPDYFRQTKDVMNALMKMTFQELVIQVAEDFR